MSGSYNSVVVQRDGWTVKEVAQEMMEQGQQDAFYIFNIDDVVRKVNHWRKMMPRVKIYYALKANHHDLMLKVAAAMDLGFDCASQGEIEQVLRYGVHPGRIIYANPTKTPTSMYYANLVRVHTTTFDNKHELIKIKEMMPNARVILRIKCDGESFYSMGSKYGCDPVTEAPNLVKMAIGMQLNLIGISFHVGTLCREAAAYSRGIAFARSLFNLAESLGTTLTILDLGGGYLGESCSDLDEVAEMVNKSLSKHFPDPSVQVIAEPGRYLVASAFTLFACIHSKREAYDTSGKKCNMFYINEGVFGAFNKVVYNEPVDMVPFKKSNDHMHLSTIWGPTCHSEDCLLRNIYLPADTTLGDWLEFPSLGAYSISIATGFNGFSCSKIYPVIGHNIWFWLKDELPMTEKDFYNVGSKTSEIAKV